MIPTANTGPQKPAQDIPIFLKPFVLTANAFFNGCTVMAFAQIRAWNELWNLIERRESH